MTYYLVSLRNIVTGTIEIKTVGASNKVQAAELALRIADAEHKQCEIVEVQ